MDERREEGEVSRHALEKDIKMLSRTTEIQSTMALDNLDKPATSEFVHANKGVITTQASPV